MKMANKLKRIIRIAVITIAVLLLISNYVFASSSNQETMLSNGIFKGLIILVAVLIIIGLVSFAVKENPADEIERAKRKEKKELKDKTKKENKESKEKRITSMGQDEEVVIEGITDNKDKIADEIDEIVKNSTNKMNIEAEETIDKIIPEEEKDLRDGTLEKEAEKKDLEKELKDKFSSAIKETASVNMSDIMNNEDESLSEDLFNENDDENSNLKIEINKQEDVSIADDEKSKLENDEIEDDIDKLQEMGKTKETEEQIDESEQTEEDLAKIFLSNMEEAMKEQAKKDDKKK